MAAKTDDGLLPEGGTPLAFFVDSGPFPLGYVLETAEAILVLSLPVIARKC